MVGDHVARSGKWFIKWAEHMVPWHEHVMRHDSIARHILESFSEGWLFQQRIPFINSRCRPDGGRTGTRLNIGRPQPRWLEGLRLAKAVLAERPQHMHGNRFLNISSMIQNARIGIMNSLPQLFNSFLVPDNV